MKKSDLLEQARIRGVELDTDIKLTNKDIEKALGIAYYKEHPEVQTWGMKRRLYDLHTPQLCFQFKELKPSEQEHIIKSENWLAETKIDGLRCITFYSPEYGFEFFSRDISEETFLPNSYTNKIVMIHNGIVRKPSSYKGLFKQSFILDAEVLVAKGEVDTTEFGGGYSATSLNATTSILGSAPERAQEIQLCGNPLMFFTFDCLEFDGKDLTHLPLRERRKFLEKLLGVIGDKVPFELPESTIDGKQEFFDRIVAEGGEGCFKGSTRINMSDGSLKRIDEVERGDYVLSYNIDSDKLESKKVLNVFDNGLKPLSNWISTAHGGNQKSSKVSSRRNYYRRIISTKGHKFYDGSGYSEINNLNYCYELSPKLDYYRKQALIGWILSDGCVDKDGCIVLSQKAEHPYLKYTLDMFKDFCGGTIKTSISGKGSLMGHIHIYKRYCKDFLNFRHDIGYSEAFKEMDAISWAYAFMGDGSVDKKRGCCFSFHSMSENDITSAILSLKKLFGVNPRLHKDKRVKNGYGCSIRLGVRDTDTLCKFIGKYIHPSMRYKFSDRYIEDFIPYPEVTKNVVKVNIVKHELAEEKTHSSSYSSCKNVRAWDIEVEDNHNYFVENVLVHNCVIKNLNEQYYATTSRKRNVQVKMKRTITDENNEDIDCFISGVIPPKKNSALDVQGLIGGVKVSVFVKEPDGTETEHWVGTISGITDSMRHKLTDHDNEGNLMLNPEYYGKVLAVTGQDFSSKNLRMAHCRAMDWNFRIDKKMNDCILTREFLESQVL